MHPISPGIPDQKGKGKGKDNDKDAHKYKDQACPRLMQGKECNFGKLWWYSHAPAVIQKAKAKAKPKAKSEPKVGNANISDSPANGTSKKPCIFFQEGKNNKCKKGDTCTYSHEVTDENETSPTGVVVCALCLDVAMPVDIVGEDVSGTSSEVRGKALSLSDVPADHLINGHMPALKDQCPVCRNSQLLEAPARRKHERDPVQDARVPHEKFGDAVDGDTLHLTKGSRGELKESGLGATLKLGLTVEDRQTEDIEFFPLPNRTWRPVIVGTLRRWA